MYYYDGRRVKSIGNRANYEGIRVDELSDPIRPEVYNTAFDISKAKLLYTDDKLWLKISERQSFVYDMLYKSWVEHTFYREDGNAWSRNTDEIWEYNNSLNFAITYNTSANHVDVIRQSSNDDDSNNILDGFYVATPDYNLGWPFREKVFYKVRVRGELADGESFTVRIVEDRNERYNNHKEITISGDSTGRFEELINVDYTGENIRIEFYSNYQCKGFVLRGIEFMYELLPEDSE